MSADKRSVSTDALATLGTIIDDKQKRDAIHLAVIPAEAGHRMAPGQHVALRDGKAYVVKASERIGIVDPFLPGEVKQGDHFWLVIYPRVITSLRHVWTHPALPDEAGTPARGEASPEVIEAKRRVAEMAAALAPSGSVEEGHAYGERVPMTYDRLMAAADRWLGNKSGWDAYTTEHGGDDWRDGSFPVEEFWDLYAVITGRAPPDDKRESFFSCTC